MPFTSVSLKARNGFFTRDEDRDFILQNLGAQKLMLLKQVHSNIAHYVTDDTQLEGDATVTDVKGLALGIITADCGPILFEDSKAKVIGAAHAGWKGARYGIIESTVKLMKEKGANNISAALGPCIHQKSYEVSEEFLNNFLSESADNKKYFIPSKKNGHLMFDLPAYIRYKLKLAGINEIETIEQDTLTNPAQFCSYRRSTLAGEPSAGRQISAICLK